MGGWQSHQIKVRRLTQCNIIFFVRVDYNVSSVVTVISPGFSVDYRFADLVLVKNGTFLPDPGLHKMPFFSGVSINPENLISSWPSL